MLIYIFFSYEVFTSVEYDQSFWSPDGFIFELMEIFCIKMRLVEMCDSWLSKEFI